MKKFNQTCCSFADRVRKRFGKRRCHHGISPLSKHYNNGPVKIHRVKGDRRQCARMADLGLYPGTEAELVCQENGSQCILKVNGSTICLDQSITENILVEGS
ncbi:FeoA family protein [Desulfopila sp. IMCC35008]|uniref:FeoA family protein n=1 Tax=Desulfopila sp. IMCC35008 TaxID=2653858 RepID=UPI0013D767CC|nr:FeoA family protein [Desulfopila sp. IMCC35008]